MLSLRKAALESTLIAAHRGVWGGNIPCNTIPAFEAALHQGADMIELDVSVSSDGQLYVFHPTMEPVHLASKDYLCDLPSSEVEKLRFVNYDATPTDQPIQTLDTVLEYLKGRCYINIDKFWMNPVAIAETVRRHDMASQILIKTSGDKNQIEAAVAAAPDLNYMLVLKEEDTLSERLHKELPNYVGVEAIFKTEASPIASDEYIEKMHRMGLLVWANAIVYNYQSVLSAGHNDDVSITGHEDEGWGWLLDHGFNIIQTDWLMALRQYMDRRNAK